MALFGLVLLLPWHTNAWWISWEVRSHTLNLSGVCSIVDHSNTTCMANCKSQHQQRQVESSGFLAFFFVPACSCTDQKKGVWCSGVKELPFSHHNSEWDQVARSVRLAAVQFFNFCSTSELQRARLFVGTSVAPRFRSHFHSPLPPPLLQRHLHLPWQQG